MLADRAGLGRGVSAGGLVPDGLPWQEKRTSQGKADYGVYKQCMRNIRPLFKQLKKRTATPPQNTHLLRRARAHTRTQRPIPRSCTRMKSQHKHALMHCMRR